MRKEATLAQWEQLYQAVDRFVEDRAWEKFEDMEIFALKTARSKKTVYCSIMGFYQECTGLAIYPGAEGLHTLAAAAKELPLAVKEYLIFESGYLIFYLDSPEILSDCQEAVLRQLHRPTDHPCVFQVQKRGCFPDDPNQAEVLFFTEILEALMEALACFYSLRAVFDFEHYAFYYDAVKKTHGRKRLKLELKEYPMIILDDEILDDLKQLPRNRETWGIDLAYTHLAYSDNLDGPNWRTKMLLIENQTRDDLLAAEMIDPTNELDDLMQLLFEILDKEGVPERIQFRNPHVVSIVGHLCQALNIRVGLQPELEIIDDFLAMISEEGEIEPLKN